MSEHRIGATRWRDHEDEVACVCTAAWLTLAEYDAHRDAEVDHLRAEVDAETKRADRLVWWKDQGFALRDAERVKRDALLAAAHDAADELDDWDGHPSSGLGGCSPGGVVRYAAHEALAVSIDECPECCARAKR